MALLHNHVEQSKRAVPFVEQRIEEKEINRALAEVGLLLHKPGPQPEQFTHSTATERFFSTSQYLLRSTKTFESLVHGVESLRMISRDEIDPRKSKSNIACIAAHLQKLLSFGQRIGIRSS